MRNTQHQKPCMKFSRFICIWLVFSLIILTLSGCTSQALDINNFDNTGFYANLKVDAYSPIGRKSAYANGRIYYLSSELGTQGIYSMNQQGEDIVLEIPAEDIRSINVREDGIYYAGFTGMKENDSGSFRQFRLLSRKNDGTDNADFLKDAGYPIPNTKFDSNVWDFYISDNGVVVICFAEVNHHMQAQLRYVASFKNEKVVSASDYKVVNESSTIHYAGFNHNRFKVGYQESLYFLADYFSDPDYKGEFLSSCLSVVDLNSIDHTVKMLTGSYLGYNDDNAYFLRWFCRGNSDEFILGSVHGLEKYDLATNTVSDIVTFDQPENVYFQIDCGDHFLVFTELLRRTYDLDYRYSNILKQTRALAESLYCVDPETGAKQLLLTLEDNNAFLYADANTAVTGGDKTISIYDITGDKAVLLRTIAIENNIVDYSNKVDTAGGWVFLYRFNEQTQRDELLEKVYIGS